MNVTATEQLTANISKLQDQFSIIGGEGDTHMIVFHRPYGQLPLEFHYTLHRASVKVSPVTLAEVLFTMYCKGARYCRAKGDIDIFIEEEVYSLEYDKVSKIVKDFQSCEEAHNFLKSSFSNLDYQLLRGWLREQGY